MPLRRSRPRSRAQTMQLPEFTDYAPARLLAVRPAAEGQAWLEIEPPPGFLERYVHPGQFCKMRVGDADGIFAMFSAPGERPVRFLVRTDGPSEGDAAGRLAALPPGSSIEMSQPAGRGFDLERARGRDLYFVATGTGVAPVRAALEHVLAHRADYGTLALDHGVRTEAHLAIREDLERWREAGIEVDVCYSHLDAEGALCGRTVQEALRERTDDLSRAAVIAVGQPEMLESLLEEVVALGGDAQLFLRNI